MKHYDMRRETRMLTDEQCREILNTGEYCIVATKDEDGWPYSVPLSYALIDGKLCFHTTNILVIYKPWVLLESSNENQCLPSTCFLCRGL